MEIAAKDILMTTFNAHVKSCGGETFKTKGQPHLRDKVSYVGELTSGKGILSMTVREDQSDLEIWPPDKWDYVCSLGQQHKLGSGLASCRFYCSKGNVPIIDCEQFAFSNVMAEIYIYFCNYIWEAYQKMIKEAT